MINFLETFAQLITYDWEENNSIMYCPINIIDEPRYQHRSLMIDTARHFQSMESLYQVLDAMAATKVIQYFLFLLFFIIFYYFFIFSVYLLLKSLLNK